MKVLRFSAVVFIMFAVMASVVFAAQKGSLKVMTKDELKARLGDADLVLLDVRKGTDWRASEFKIKGAVRLDPRSISKLTYPKDATIVLYCA